ncbi:MAG: hypothetical protein ACOX7K_00150 [Oscillospiraceae bacterium]|jgi:hypothetical protein
MSEFEEKLNSLLNDPEQMGKITQMAKSLMDGGQDALPARTAPAASDAFDLGIDMEMVAKLGKMLSGKGGGNSHQRALLEAMTPYLGEKRQRRMEQALKMAKMAKMARLAFSEFGGDGGE